MAGDEPDLAGGSITNAGGGFSRGGVRRAIAGRIAAKVTTDGVRKLTSEFTGLLGVLQKVRGELAQINSLARNAGGMGGIGQGTPTGAAGTQPTSPTGGGGGFGVPGAALRGPGGFSYGGAMIAGAAALNTGLGVIENRFQRNVAQSAPISSRDVMTASMYGPSLYQRLEGSRFQASGEFGGSRADQQTAQQIALQFGSTMAGSSMAMRQFGMGVQATGGSMNIAQVASQTGLFASPMVSRRASVMGVTQYRENGILQDPNKIGLDYLKNYEKRLGVTFNEIDFSNLRAPGSPHRARMKMIYGLSDEAIDVAIRAGMQNMQFRNKGGGRDINFGSARDLSSIGLNRDNALGLQIARLGTTTERREARFFRTQEDDMINRAGRENTIQEILSDTEEAFSDLIGPMHEFARELKVATTVLGALGAISLMGGMGGMGGGGGGGLAGGLLSMLTGRGGAGAAGGQMTLPGMGAPGGRLAGLRGAMGAMGGGGALMGAAGLGVGIAGVGIASNARTPGGMAMGIGATTAGGAMLGSVIPGVGTLVGAGVGLAVGTAFAAKNYFGARNKRDVSQGFDEGIGMSDAQLIRSLGDYVNNAAPGGQRRGQGAGPKQRGRFDAFAARRGALLAAALDESMTSGKFNNLSTAEAGDLAELVTFFSGEGVLDDNKLWENKGKAEQFVSKIRGGDIWRKYFGSVADPFAFSPVNTNESQSLITTAEQRYQAGTAQTGDAAFAAFGLDSPNRGDPIDDRVASKGETWNRLDSRMKDRLLRMFRASGGRVWLGEGWRTSATQEKMFRDRYRVDPNGSIEWNGQKWRHVSGAAAAPPGRSMHEIGLAADLEGDMGWMNAHAAEFQLKHFANVNNENWHVQPIELPNSRREFEQGGGTSDSGAGGASGGAATATTPPTTSGGGGGGGGAAAFTGIGYSIASAAQGTTAGGGFMTPATAGGTAAAGAAGGSGGSLAPSGPWPADELARGVEVVKALKAAGFSGDELQEMAAISYWESKWNPNAFLEKGGDMSYGLFALNRKPWLDQGLTPPFSKEDAFNPVRAAQIARSMFLNQAPYNGPQHHGPYTPWTTRDKPLDPGIRARQAANIGDGPFDLGTTPMASAGSANVSINVSINSTGNVNYDAKALGEAVRPVLSNVMAEISTKRGS